jgi:hypothetical protein
MDEHTLHSLRELCFGKDGMIRLDLVNPATYRFSEYRGRGHCHPTITGYCVSCETHNPPINEVAREHTEKFPHRAGFRLVNISHGATSEDFIQAIPAEDQPDRSDWRKDSVMFLFESPSKDLQVGKAGTACADLYHAPIPCHSFLKRPAQKWYWIIRDHPQRDVRGQVQYPYPHNFCGGLYGELILSILLTFRLNNAYVTNLVKCGMNAPDGRSPPPGINAFNPGCVSNCYKQFLKKEIAILKPKVIFAFGSAVRDRIDGLWRASPVERLNAPVIQVLPHPARRRSGFSDEYYRVLYFWLIVRGLIRAAIINMQEAQELARVYLQNEPWANLPVS